jgi:hypothetical protein
MGYTEQIEPEDVTWALEIIENAQRKHLSLKEKLLTALTLLCIFGMLAYICSIVEVSPLVQ